MLIYGVSPDAVKAQSKFANKFAFPFPLLSDSNTELCQALGIWVEKSMYGKTYMGVDRSTYLVDAEGRISHIWSKVKPDGHAEEVLAFLKSR